MNSMNSPPGVVPLRPPMHAHHQVAPIVIPPRMHPRQMLRTNQRGLHPVPVHTPQHSYRRHQPFVDPNMRHPFRPPMMPFMPYPVPIGMFVQPQGFGRAMPLPPMPVHPQTQQVHHVHHHHYHAPHHFDSSPSNSERAFPSREAWQRHARPDPSPQVYDPDGYPIGAANDGGPEVVDAEEGGPRPGTEMILHGAERHHSARYFAARAAEREYEEETRRGVGIVSAEQRTNSPVNILLGTESTSRIPEEEIDEVTPHDVRTREITPVDSSHDSTVHPVSKAGCEDAGRPKELRADQLMPGGSSEHPLALQHTSPRKSRSLREKQMPPPVDVPLHGQPRARSLHSQAILNIRGKTTGDVVLLSSPDTALSDTDSMATITPQSPPVHIPPDTMNTAVDRLLETTGLSARQFMQMLDDRTFVLDVEKYKEARGGPDANGRQ